MQLGMIGLGRMGANMVRRLMRAGTSAWCTTAPDADAGRWREEGAAVPRRSTTSSPSSARRARSG